MLVPLLCALVGVAASLPTFPATTLRPDDLRVASIAYRLAVDGRAHCPGLYPLTGLLLHHLAEYDESGRSAEIARHALDRGPGVLATVADSPAARAGLAAGDVLLALNGTPFPDPKRMIPEKRSGNWRAPIEASEAWLEAALGRGPADLQILRAGMVITVRLEARQGCPARVRLARSNQANAFATGAYVVMTTRFLVALHSDDELAIIIGHEMAHNILHHREGLGSGSRATPGRAAEDEADRLGLKLAAAAGYDLRAAIPMWRRIHARFGGGIHLVRTHPSLSARERSIQQVIAEIERNRAAPLPAG